MTESRAIDVGHAVRDMAALSAALTSRYVVERELGRGGMATVYLADDVRHRRKVAIKVLRPELAAVLGAERFVHEITTTAALQHPNILPLFDSGEADGFLYYVMPYIDGDTLRAKLDRETQLGIEESVTIATVVADAVDYAHRQGVIHRDLKPENILLHEGRPIVADFGIALAVSAAAGGRMTETGLSLGTPHYMSPEQATAEQESTARSDIFSLASVLYEMLAGSPPHVGASAQQIIAKIVTEEPAPVTTLRKAVPPNVAAAVVKALQKLPADRFPSAAAFARALGDPSFRVHTPGQASGRSALTIRDRLHDPVQQTLAAAALIALASAAWLGVRPQTPLESAPVQFVLTSATARPVMTRTWPALVSPDGRYIVYAGEAGNGNYQLYVRRLDRLDARPLPASAGAGQPIFSPDGRWVAFEAGGQLLKAPVEGGAVVPIVAANGRNGAAWTSRGEIILGSETGAIQGLARVPDTGGKLTPLTTTGDPTGATLHLWPILLEDGRTILMTIFSGGQSPGKSNDVYQLAMTSLDDGIVHPLRIAGVRALGVVGDRLIYLQADGTVMAVPFDARRKQLTGTSIRLLDSIPLCGECVGDSPIYLSTSGALAYIRGAPPSRLLWIDSTGTERVIGSRDAQYANPRLSPDGRRIAVTISGPQKDVWIYEIESATWTRLTSGGDNSHPEWTADGSRVVFVSNRGGQVRAWSQAADFSDTAEAITPVLEGLQAAVPSRSGAVLVLNDFRNHNFDVWSMTLAAGQKPVPFVSGSYSAGLARPTADGRQVAYTSAESGQDEVYVRPYPGPGGRVQVSSGGGSQPVWSRDGRLFYKAGQRMMVATLSPAPNVRVLSRDSLSVAPPLYNLSGATYDVAADGRTFLMLRTDDRNVQLVIALDWATQALADAARR